MTCGEVQVGEDLILLESDLQVVDDADVYRQVRLCLSWSALSLCITMPNVTDIGVFEGVLVF